MTLTEKVEEVAMSSGLDLVGIASADAFEGYRWGHLIMRNPRLSMSEAKSLVIVAVCDLKKLREPQVTERRGKVASRVKIIPPIGSFSLTLTAACHF